MHTAGLDRPCKNACSACDGNALFRKVDFDGARLLLIKLFLQRQGESFSLDQELPNKIRDFPNSAKFLFGSRGDLARLVNIKGFCFTRLEATP
jgi:hypothetical protein